MDTEEQGIDHDRPGLEYVELRGTPDTVRMHPECHISARERLAIPYKHPPTKELWVLYYRRSHRSVESGQVVYLYQDMARAADKPPRFPSRREGAGVNPGSFKGRLPADVSDNKQGRI